MEISHRPGGDLVARGFQALLFEPRLDRYPAVNPASFRRAVEDAVREWRRSRDEETHR